MAAAAVASTQAYLAQLQTAQQALTQQLAALDVPVLFAVQRVYNGVAVLADAEQSAAIAQLPGVAAVHPLIPKLPHNASSIPYLGVPALWQGSGLDGLPAGVRGEGIRVAVIDTGVDYLHRDFAGPGTGYTQNNPTKVGDVPGYPGLRVVGGYDFAGDAYNATASQPGYQLIPRSDPDPMDCYGHGTHVAGTLAGSGVTASGATFTGPYAENVDFDSLSIGPGMAPHADIYAIKIFGCAGSTNLTDLALEWAVDPDGNGDFADHMDVVNLSLGSPFGAAYDSSAVSANNAALAGVIVVASAGNSGDTQFITGAPAVADRAISVAASQHTADSLAGFSSRGPRRGDAALKPDLAAPGVSIYSADSGSGRGGVSASGTSMAAPHVAGLMALLRQAHPEWTVEELKALAMNTAAPLWLTGSAYTSTLDLPAREGAGRIDPQAAMTASLVAYAADGSGRVSLSFGSPAVLGTYTATQQLAIANKSAEEAWVQIEYESRTQIPGVQVRTPEQPIHVPPFATVSTPITLVADAAQMKRVRPPTLGADEELAWLAEESGNLVLRPAAGEARDDATFIAASPAATAFDLHVPVYAAPRPQAAMAAATTALDFSAGLQQTIVLTGTTLAGSAPPTDVVALASVFELRLRSPNTRPQWLDPNALDLYDHADLKYVGVMAQAPEAADVADNTIYFGVTTWAPWSTPGEIEIDVWIDVDEDGDHDYLLYNTATAELSGFWPGPAYASRLLNLRTYEVTTQEPLNGISPNRYDSALFFQSALVLAVNAGDLGLSAAQSRFAFRITTDSKDVTSGVLQVIDRTPVMTYDVGAPALRFVPPDDTAPLWPDAPSTAIQVTMDPASQARSPAAGVLILHHHNAPTAQASLVSINYRWPVNVHLPVIKR